MSGVAQKLSRAVAGVGLALLAVAGDAQPGSTQPGSTQPGSTQPAPTRLPPPVEPRGRWSRVPLAPGSRVDTRPQPPKEGRKACVSVNAVAGAQLFGDSAIELTMKNGKRYRMFFASECPALSFYQGFYYRRQKAGQLCAGRDVVGARSGGECQIASIIPVRIPNH